MLSTDVSTRADYLVSSLSLRLIPADFKITEVIPNLHIPAKGMEVEVRILLCAIGRNVNPGYRLVCPRHLSLGANQDGTK